MTPQHPPASLYRTTEGLGLWEHRGKVAAVGVGHSPTARRWDGTPETCVGAWSILALRRAIADAGVSPDQIDGLVLDPVTTTGAYWPEGAPIPMDVVNAFHPTSDPLDGIAKLSAEWIIQNMPELTNIQFVMYGPRCMSHAIVAAFITNSRRNGLLCPEGYWAQHRPEQLTTEDYLAARWIAKPASLFDNDIPIMVSAAYLFTTPEQARDMQQKPVYILNHASSRATPRSLSPTLEEVEAETAKTGRKLYEGAGITAADLSFENMYDGFTLFHQFHLEGLRYRGMQCGEALDFYQTDISIAGPNPVS